MKQRIMYFQSMSTATEMLQKYIEAEAAILEGQSVSFEGRTLTMSNLSEVVSGREKWQRAVNAEKARAKKKSTFGGRQFGVARFNK